MGIVLAVGGVFYVFQEVLEFSPWWSLVGTVGVASVCLAGALAWKLIVKRGMFTWMRLAQMPIKLMARGDAVAAEEAYSRGLARADRFAVDDHRRGLMLCELAMYAKNQGRYADSLTHYEESTRVLGLHLATNPLDYFVVLNNHAICYVHLRDFENAQRMLEKALDLTLAARKNEARTAVTMPLAQVQWLQFVLHMNLAFLFIEMHELGEAEGQLREADDLAPLLPARNMKTWHDHYVGLCAYWEFEAGRPKQAERELADASNPDYPVCLRVRAKLALSRQQYAEADEALRKFRASEEKKGPLQRPELYKTALELAEARFGLGKREDAFAALAEARAIVADFKLPADSVWRRSMQTWAQRAQALGKADVLASLEAELQMMPASPQAITILDKFRAQPR
jgi:tetratricopeptide (TPR) repeat protein